MLEVLDGQSSATGWEFYIPAADSDCSSILHGLLLKLLTKPVSS